MHAGYDGLILDPPPFGHGPKGEIWKFDKSLPVLLDACRALLSEQPLFVVLTAYTLMTSLPELRRTIAETVKGHGGSIEAGETVLLEKSAGRTIPAAMFVRWSP